MPITSANYDYKHKQCLLFYVKWPEPGKVKTRLAKSLGHMHAVGLYKCFILDMLSTFKNNPQPVCICYDPKEAKHKFEHWLGKGYHYMPQSGHNLSDRMRRSFQDAFQSGFKSVCLVGSDIPALPAEYLTKAFGYLYNYDSVIGPSYDGGYYLIGFNQATFFPEIFQNIQWSKATVYQKTIEKYKQHSTKFLSLFSCHDIDTLNDLKKWHKLNQQNKIIVPHTLAYIHSIAELIK